MKNIHWFKLCLLALFLQAASCERFAERDYPIYLQNNASHSIGYYFATGGNEGTTFPDTTLPVSNRYVGTNLAPGKAYGYHSGLPWNGFFEEHERLLVYVFHADTLAAYDWPQLREDYNILRRYELDLSELEAMAWRISYP
ncbi:MAG: hypothetical protein AAFV95_24265 [Bacteroidota bacterium]